MDDRTDDTNPAVTAAPSSPASAPAAPSIAPATAGDPRAALLGKRPSRRATVDLSRFGLPDIDVVAFGSAARARLFDVGFRKVTKEGKDGAEEVEVEPDMEKYNPLLLILAGRRKGTDIPVFHPGDEPAIGEMDGELVDLLVKEAGDVNGLNKKAKDEAKNG